jgi:ribosomal protein S7
VNTPSSYKTSVAALWRRPRLVLSLMIAGSLFAGTVNAQVIVSDPILEGTQSSSLAKQVLQYSTEYSQYLEIVAQFNQLLMTVQSLGANIQLMPTQLQQVDASTFVDQACPGTTGGSPIGMLVSAIQSISPNQSITGAQQTICAEIVTLEVDEYNKTAVAMNQMNTMGGTLQKLNQLSSEVNSLGTAGGTTTQAEVFNSNMQTLMNQWRGAIAGDQTMIQSLQEQQAILSKIALMGSNTVLGNVVQATALKAAFTANQ